MLKPYLRWILLLSLLCSVPASGRSWLGAFFSTKASGLSSMSSIGEDESRLLKTDILLDMNGVFRGWNSMPGLQIRVAGEYILASHVFSTGTGFRFLAGPGLVTGFVSDSDNAYGFVGGVSGGMSMLFDFRHDISISLSWSADFCLHYRAPERHPTLTAYRNGLLRAYVPELRILYQF